MNYKKVLACFFGAFALVSCHEVFDDLEEMRESAVEMNGVSPSMSRASGSIIVADLKDYVGRKDFVDNDIIEFTSIRRTDSPINQFTYEDLQFQCAVTQDDNVVSTGWNRVVGTGSTAADHENHPDRIYWSDATSPHTFIGYCLPQQRNRTLDAFDWKKQEEEGINVYYGSLGNPDEILEPDETTPCIIDYSSRYDGSGNETVSGNNIICEDDILLTHSTSIVAEDAIAKLNFYHGLAQVRVIVNISDFASAGGDDTKSVVSDMTLKQMLTMYKWKQTNAETLPLVEVDQTYLNTLYSEDVSWNQKKDVKLWIPAPKGDGLGASRTFTFYGLAVPTEFDEHGLTFSFKVTYPDPMEPQTKKKTAVYTASVPSAVHFSAGKCTTINISLNHRNEKMTVGAEYMDWEFVDTPDQGSLKKNSTFLSTTVRTADASGNYNVTIVGDPNANADDATWLYEKDGQIVDVYDNDGTAAKPYTISTANQLLSFAYEVKNGRTFEGKFVKLDADIHLQTTSTVDWIVANSHIKNPEDRPTMLNWIGVGDDVHAFNGNFIGGGRHITHLNGEAFFKNVGGKATVSELNLSDVVMVTGHGALAERSAGFMYACRVEGDVESDNDYVGSLCGTNSGYIFACIHNGGVKGTKNGAKVGGLLGRNEGTLAVSYHTGAILGSDTYGVVEKVYAGSKIYACYFNSTLATPSHTVDPVNVQGRTLGQMQSRSFAETDLNAKILDIVNNTDGIQDKLFENLFAEQKAALLYVINQYHFVFSPGAYPRVEKKVVP